MPKNASGHTTLTALEKSLLAVAQQLGEMVEEKNLGTYSKSLGCDSCGTKHKIEDMTLYCEGCLRERDRLITKPCVQCCAQHRFDPDAEFECYECLFKKWKVRAIEREEESLVTQLLCRECGKKDPWDPEMRFVCTPCFDSKVLVDKKLMEEFMEASSKFAGPPTGVFDSAAYALAVDYRKDHPDG